MLEQVAFNFLRGIVISSTVFWLVLFLPSPVMRENAFTDVTLHYIILTTFASPALILGMYFINRQSKAWLYLAFPMVNSIIGIALVIPVVEAISGIVTGSIFYK